MRKNFGPKTLMYPEPVLIIGTYAADGTPNAMNAAWGGLSEENEISICISANHTTTKNLLERKAFTVSFADTENVAAADYVGIVSGNNEPNKLEKCGWHTEKAEFVDAPIICELPVAIECKLKSYDENTCRLVGEIVNICAEESVLGDDGLIDLGKFSPIIYDGMRHDYRRLGDIVGKAFSEGKKIGK